jgi:glycosyltransferase involved in cell wall biosynthesis
MNPALRIILSVADLSPSSGGPSRSVPGLARALAQAGAKVEIVTLAPTDGDVPSTGVPTVFVPADKSRFRDLRAVAPWREQLQKRCAEGTVDIIHDAGLWLPVNHCTATVAKQFRLPRVVSPRGMLEAWAREHRSTRKAFAWRLYQRRDLGRAALLHATSPEEAAGLRAAGLKNPIGVVPNGVDIPQLTKPRPILSPRRALFLSRLHPKKGLLDLVQAWAAVRPADWSVIVAGPDEGGHLADVRKAVSTAGLEKVFDFVGAVDDSAKWALFRDAELFVLPTHSENFGLAIAEALASGLPVITTHGTPWREIATERLGWWIPTGAEALAGALREALALAPDVLVEMGARGRRIMKERYSWSSAAERLTGAYRWLLGGEDRPSYIDVV